ncbi:hypothetical protein GGR57DRAFT_506634 [Xylariaceae sp. FL1272]|nr:hypothetical protein GGR57DRAFT_506634 [Xylariaceae sp. FL1272]
MELDTPAAKELASKNLRDLIGLNSWSILSVLEAAQLDMKAQSLLTTGQPQMLRGGTWPTSPTRNKNYAKISPHHIREFKGFTRANIELMYGDLLSAPIGIRVDERQKFLDRAKETFTIEIETHLNFLGKVWMKPILDPCLTQCANALLKRLGLDPKDLELRDSQKLKLLKPDAPYSWMKPDWMVLDLNHPQNTQVGKKQLSRRADVVGDDKLSTVFKPERIGDLLVRNSSVGEEHDVEELKANLQWTLRQLATYAFAAGTRYAFIRTDETITFLRFFLVESTGECPVENTLGFEYHWAYTDRALGPDDISLNLGIFALTMMAQNDCHRALVREEALNDISVWYETTSNGGTSYFHPLSHTTVFEKPSHCTTILPWGEQHGF